MQTVDQRAVHLEQLTITWNDVEAIVAVVAGVIAGRWPWWRSAWTR